MAKSERPYWQICMTCDRREYSADPVTCRCGTKMIDVIDHPDNAWQSQKSQGPGKPQKPASTSP